MAPPLCTPTPVSQNSNFWTIICQSKKFGSSRAKIGPMAICMQTEAIPSGPSVAQASLNMVQDNLQAYIVVSN
jgi:hypothetical protein